MNKAFSWVFTRKQHLKKITEYCSTKAGKDIFRQSFLFLWSLFHIMPSLRTKYHFTVEILQFLVQMEKQLRKRAAINEPNLSFKFINVSSWTTFMFELVLRYLCTILVLCCHCVDEQVFVSRNKTCKTESKLS